MSDLLVTQIHRYSHSLMIGPIEYLNILISMTIFLRFSRVLLTSGEERTFAKILYHIWLIQKLEHSCLAFHRIVCEGQCGWGGGSKMKTSAGASDRNGGKTRPNRFIDLEKSHLFCFLKAHSPVSAIYATCSSCFEKPG